VVSTTGDTALPNRRLRGATQLKAQGNEAIGQRTDVRAPRSGADGGRMLAFIRSFTSLYP
jgi:hypothetical protein